MQEVRRKSTHARRHGRWLLLLLAVAALAALIAGWRLSARKEPLPEIKTYEDTAETLLAHEADEVARIAVTLRSGEGWTAVQSVPGSLTMEDNPDFAVAAGYAASILNAARIVSCEAVLTDDPALYRDDLAAFGLDDPRLIAAVSYTDGSAITFRVGDAVSDADMGWLYMTVDGDDRLFALDRGTADDLTVDRALLYPVTQPVLHAARMDHITLTGADGDIIGEWMLEGSIGDADAADRWLLVAPVRYPAAADALTALKTNLAALRLGAYVGPATEENLTACGFAAPRLTIAVHQAAGSIGETSAAGEYALTDWPESEFILTVGGAQNADVDYILYEDAIYTGSHYLLSFFMDKDCADTLSRYIAPTALGNLERLTVETGAGTDEYVIIRTEQVAENNELVTDENGHPVYDYACTLNGEPYDYAALEASYARLIVATVSGPLPQGWTTQEPPHTTYAFCDISGDVHTVGFATFDALHDAVLVDGEAVFYLIKGGFEL